jgi:hypothetical protein
MEAVQRKEEEMTKIHIIKEEGGSKYAVEIHAIEWQEGLRWDEINGFSYDHPPALVPKTQVKWVKSIVDIAIQKERIKR